MDKFLPGEAPVRGESILAGEGETERLMRERNWAETPLGSAASWPQSLRTAVSICLASHFPMLIWWGPELVMLYNDAYSLIVGTKHPQALGQRGRECWPEIWDIIGPMLEGVLSGGEATWSENQLLLLERNGYAEECYFTFSYSPIRDETGGIGGVFTAVTETTGQVISERRLRTLRILATSMVEARKPEDVCQRAAEVLADNAADLPFAALYMLATDGKQATLAGTAHFPRGIQAVPEVINLADAEALWPFASVAAIGQAMVVNLSASLREQISSLSVNPLLPAPHTALVLPVTRADQARPSGFLVAGISPRQSLDEEYQGFLSLIAGHVATALASARAYQDAQERARALAELDRAKTTFFNNISHEFRTPLTLSLGPLEMLLTDPEYPLVEEQRAKVEMVRRNALRQLKLVNTLLDFARIEAGRAEAAYVPTDLSQFTTDLASTFRAAIERAGLQLIVECPPLPELVYVDQDMWEKIVLNLLSNAFKFTFAGFIRLALSAIDGCVELVVQDSGIGVQEADVPHLFERFYRAHATQARSQEGSGIGLALVQELVRLHGGGIMVQSTEGVGTTFTIRVPLGSSHLPAEHLHTTRAQVSTALGSDPYVEEALRWLPDASQNEEEFLDAAPADTTARAEVATSANSFPGAPVGQNSRVLVVDDNADMREYLKRLLSTSYQVLLAGDGNTAFTLARGVCPDLILSDVMMPGLDGFALLKALKSERATANIPVILLSARAGEEATLEGLQAGANDYLIKPFSAREMLARIQAQLEMARLRREAEAARQHLQDLFMQAPAMICVLHGPQHIYELANPLYHQLVGQRELLGRALREALPELDGQGFYELLDHVYATGEPFIGTEVRVELDRENTGKLEEGYFNFVYQPIRAARGEVEGVMVHAVEVTEQVHARQQMNTFLGIASHELKNPLTSIKGNVEIALRRVGKALPMVPQEAKDLLDILEGVSLLLKRADQQIAFQNRLVGDLVDTTRIQAGKLELRVEPADLSMIVWEAVEEQRQHVPARTIHLDLPAQATQLLTIDADRIGQVVTNYLSNALKYSEKDREVFVRIEWLEKAVRVAVEDAGPGLSVS